MIESPFTYEPYGLRISAPSSGQQRMLHPLVVGCERSHKAFAALSPEQREDAIVQMHKLGTMVETIAAKMHMKPPPIIIGANDTDFYTKWFASAITDGKKTPRYCIYITPRYIKHLGALGTTGQARDALCFTDEMISGIIGHELAHIKTGLMDYEHVPALQERYHHVYDFERNTTELVKTSNRQDRNAALKHNHAIEHLMDVVSDRHTNQGKPLMAALTLMERDRRESVLRHGHTPVQLAELKAKNEAVPELSVEQRFAKRALRGKNFGHASDTHPSYTRRCDVVREAEAGHNRWIRKLRNQIRTAEVQLDESKQLCR